MRKKFTYPRIAFRDGVHKRGPQMHCAENVHKRGGEMSIFKFHAFYPPSFGDFLGTVYGSALFCLDV